MEMLGEENHTEKNNKTEKKERRKREKKERLKHQNTNQNTEEEAGVENGSNVFVTADGLKDKEKKKRKKKSLENIDNQEEESESQHKKPKFDIKLTSSSKKSKKEPKLNLTDNLLGKKGKGPKIITVQDNHDNLETNKNSKKRNNKVKEGHIHETKGLTKSLTYLHLWKSNRAAWKFEKSRQNWLVMHAYDKRICKEDFEKLLDYLKSIRGGMREVTIKNARHKVKQLSVGEEVQDTDDNKLIKERAEKILATMADAE